MEQWADELGIPVCALYWGDEQCTSLNGFNTPFAFEIGRQPDWNGKRQRAKARAKDKKAKAAGRQSKAGMSTAARASWTCEGISDRPVVRL